jgi:thymidylate synthase (FAD)
VEVRLIKYTPDPELCIAAAARQCYSAISGSEILEKLNREDAERRLRKAIASGHHSVLEHAVFTFSIDGLSRAASHQLVRHRVASYSQQSQRYVNQRKPEFVVPPSIAGKQELVQAYNQAVTAAFEFYGQLRDAGIAAEDARYVLPNATTTRIVMTMNARELIHVASVRLCNRAQWEILNCFEAIKSEVTNVAPIIGEFMQPKCEQLGYCDEEQSCGRMPGK